VGSELFPLLRQPGQVTQTTRTVLLSSDGDKVVYLSPLERTGQPEDPMGLAMEKSTPDLDAAFAVATGSGIIAAAMCWSRRAPSPAARRRRPGC
jgi:hypothetical protein